MMESHPRKGQARHEIRARIRFKLEGGVCCLSLGRSAACYINEGGCDCGKLKQVKGPFCLCVDIAKRTQWFIHHSARQVCICRRPVDCNIPRFLWEVITAKISEWDRRWLFSSRRGGFVAWRWYLWWRGGARFARGVAFLTERWCGLRSSVRF